MPNNREVDAAVGLPIDGAGKQVAVKEVTRADGSVVEREEGVVADASDPAATQTVHGERGRGAAEVSSKQLAELLTKISNSLEHIEAMLMQHL